ncbi:hypothetical protein F383_23921 [Gossypium arboreum]|uniref:Uncharacterized protein n=1 Tax=Gossypium arboreum TaxID=29729 RepID=A0A0B0MQ70_GOSAR|nr:hypothetical protein F383_23921 [Gossypium arboreum]
MCPLMFIRNQVSMLRMAQHMGM